MEPKSHPNIYENIGQGYSNRRQPDPRIAKAIRSALGDAVTVCNIGAGTGSYEPNDLVITAVEPSKTMINQRINSHEVICARAEELPFSDGAFDASMAILSVHHWTNPQQGLAEMKRVSKRQVVFTFDLEFQDSLWLVRDYLPEITEFEKNRSLALEAIADSLDASELITVPIPHDCTDGFQAAYWRRPELYLKRDVQASISTLAQLPQEIIVPAMQRLSCDLETGAWHKRHGNLLSQVAMDFGYRILVADSGFRY